MTLLLDTQLLLWSQAEPHRLPMAVSKELENPDSAPYFSVVSIWEVIIKAALKRGDFDHDAAMLRAALLRLGWQELELTGYHVLAVADLKAGHGDPFDRVLVSQAKVEGLAFVTTDAALVDYGHHVQLVKGRKVKPKP